MVGLDGIPKDLIIQEPNFHRRWAKTEWGTIYIHVRKMKAKGTDYQRTYLILKQMCVSLSQQLGSNLYYYLAVI